MPLLLAVLMQVAPTLGADPLRLPPEVQDRLAREAAGRPVTTVPVPTIAPSAGCIAEIEADPVRGAEAAQAALDKSVGAERARAGLCLGIALTELERWDEAQAALVAARDAAGAQDHASRARLGAMAGNAALAGGDAPAALAILVPAQAEAKSAGDAALGGAIAIDRARALVSLDRAIEASAALAEARTLGPQDAQAWLLSATLARRQNDLVQAQAMIERAAQLRPVDPEIGLEAGVIAMLAGREDAARRSWQSVVAAAPGSALATTASGYLAQLGATGASTP